MDKKLKRRLTLLDDLLDYALRSDCQFAMCDGPEAPIRYMKTCSRCSCIHRAIQMGLVRRTSENRFVRTGLGVMMLVPAGSLEQLSVIDGRRVN